MAIRPVFVAKESVPFFEISNVEFTWNSGFAKSQKQKNICAIHQEFESEYPGKKVLEISSKSMQEGGEALSAFFLQKEVPSLGKSVSVECVYQAGKVFKHGGPYLDLLEKTSREAKRDERLQTSGPLDHFEFEGKSYPLIPKTIFYDYIYINALFENKELTKTLLQYDAFTDIEFNPNKGINCQAKAAATFVALVRMGLIEKVRNFEDFIQLYQMSLSEIQKSTGASSRSDSSKPANISPKVNTSKSTEVSPKADASKSTGNSSGSAKASEAPEKTNSVEIAPGFLIRHKTYGEGTVLEIEGTAIKATFPSHGEKTLSMKWCEKNCQFEKK